MIDAAGRDVEWNELKLHTSKMPPVKREVIQGDFRDIAEDTVGFRRPRKGFEYALLCGGGQAGSAKPADEGIDTSFPDATITKYFRQMGYIALHKLNMIRR